MRRRISILKEDRAWNLRCQGYSYDAIGRITNLDPSSLTAVLRRVRRRPPVELDPIRRGRRRGFLSDEQVDDIRLRRSRGESLRSIAASYAIDPTSIWCICAGKSYRIREDEPGNGYPFSFTNRLRSA